MRSKDTANAHQWENTCEDLAKELKYVQGELTQKELVFARMEQELRVRLEKMGETQSGERSEMCRRIEELEGEVKQLQNVR